MLIKSSSSIEFKRIAGEKKVNEFRDGLKILYSMVKLFLKMHKIQYYRNNILETLCFFLISILPIIIFLGSGLLNLAIIIIDLLFLIEIYRTKKLKFLNNKFFYLLIFLWATFVINLIFFSVDSSNSILRTVGFLRFILFVLLFNIF